MTVRFLFSVQFVILFVACQSAEGLPTAVPSPPPQEIVPTIVTQTPVPNLTTALVAHYPFDGDAMDASGNGNDGTVQGASLMPDRFGNPASAYLFDGQDDIIDIAYNPNRSLDLAFEASINLWLYYQPQTKGPFYTIVEKSDPERGGHSRYGLWVINDTVEFCIQPAATDFHNCLDGTFALEPNTWQMITAVYDGTTLTLYYNGERDSSFMGSRDAISQSPYELFIGADRYSDSVVYLAGGIDELRLYKRVLSEAEVAELYTAVPP